MPCYFSQGLIKALLEENFAKELEYSMKEPILFGDYRNALEESEPRLYEDIQDYDAAKALFTEVAHCLVWILYDLFKDFTFIY